MALCHYSTSFDEENFADASDFRPDRWIRKDSTDRVDNFGSIPFGYGIRSCIGKRIAELEMHLALTRVGDIYILLINKVVIFLSGTQLCPDSMGLQDTINSYQPDPERLSQSDRQTFIVYDTNH